MSEHEVSRVVRADSDRVFAVVSDVGRLPEWLPTVRQAEAAAPGTGTDVHLEGERGSAGHYASDGFWRPSAEQRRVEWSTPSRGGQEGTYAGWLQLEDRGGAGDQVRTEVVVHLSFFDVDAPPGVEAELSDSLDRLAQLVEG